MSTRTVKKPVAGAAALMFLCAVPGIAQEQDHAAHGDAAHTDHSQMDHSRMNHDAPASLPREPIPVLTDEDRAAAFPDLPPGHAMHGTRVERFVLLNRAEAWDDGGEAGVAWDAKAWAGTDIDRLWLRSEGEQVGGRTEAADLEVLYGRSVAPWWDLVAGVRQDFGPGPSQTFAAFGIMGLAPYKFEINATGYVGESGQSAARLEIEYELPLSGRLFAQPMVELNAYGKHDPARHIGSGLATAEAGLRVRYEINRQLAPYLGVVWERSFGGTADLRRAEGDDIEDTRAVLGLRVWF